MISLNSHGADTLRLYEMFMGPLDGSIAWSANGVDGSRTFLRSNLASIY